MQTDNNNVKIVIQRTNRGSGDERIISEKGNPLNRIGTCWTWQVYQFGGMSTVIVVAAVERTDRNIIEENISDLWESIK